MEENKVDVSKWYSFSKLSSAEQLNEYFKNLNKKDKKYYHYTSLKAIDSIIESKEFIISSVDHFNDKKDSKQFGDENEQKRFFSLCFSRGAEENLPLWYLYSGIDGKGGRLCFTRNKLEKILSDTTDKNELRFSLWEYDYKHHKKIKKIGDLKENVDIKIKFHDILYYRADDKKVRLKYNTLTNNGEITKEEVEKYIDENRGFNKGLIWYHEKEERLLIEIIGELDLKKECVVVCKIDDIIKHAKITTAPEINDKEELKKYTNINNFMFDSSSVDLSEHHGDIEMKICDKCNYKEKICPDCDKNKEEAIK